MHDRRADRAERQERQREADALNLLGEDVLLDRGAALAAVLLRPADPEPAVLRQLLEDPRVLRASALGAAQLLAHLVGDQLGEVRAQLVAERGLSGV